jgi:hypothetical protein
MIIMNAITDGSVSITFILIFIRIVWYRLILCLFNAWFILFCPIFVRFMYEAFRSTCSFIPEGKVFSFKVFSVFTSRFFCQSILKSWWYAFSFIVWKSLTFLIKASFGSSIFNVSKIITWSSSLTKFTHTYFSNQCQVSPFFTSFQSLSYPTFAPNYTAYCSYQTASLIYL